MIFASRKFLKIQPNLKNAKFQCIFIENKELQLDFFNMLLCNGYLRGKWNQRTEFDSPPPLFIFFRTTWEKHESVSFPHCYGLNNMID